MASDVQICNLALSRIGQKEFIESLDDDTPQAIACNVVYGPTRDTVLASFRWPFATKHAWLEPLLPAPATPYRVARSGWGYAFTLPGNFLDAQYIFSGVRPGASLATSSVVAEAVASAWAPPPVVGLGAKVPFAIEGADDDSCQLLFCDLPSPELVYTSLVTVADNFPPLFAEALAWSLAAELCLSLPVQVGKAKDCTLRYQQALAAAAAAAFRGQQEDPQPDSELIAVRG